MRLSVCLDDRNGMLFLGRRLSQDGAVREAILADAGNGTVWMNGYSAAQFPEGACISVAEDFWRRAGAQDMCFVENVPVEHFLPAKEIVIYRWNRHYPSDVKFPLEYALQGLRLLSVKEFAGTSHEWITREVYGI